MNRPLFFAVMCFALGEVIYIIAENGNQVGAIIMAPICVAIILTKLKSKKIKILLSITFIIFGAFRMWIADKNAVDQIMFGDALCELKVDTYEEYTLSYIEYDDNISGGVFLKGVGIVDNLVVGDTGYNITIKIVESHTDQHVISHDYKVMAYGIEACSIGDIVKVEGVIKPFVGRGNPGEFNNYNYYRARGIIGCIELEKIEFGKVSVNMTVPEKCWYRIKAFLYEARSVLKSKLYFICDGKNIEIYSGMILGDKSGISSEDMLLYRLSGIAHIFAISGLHISIVGGLLYRILRRTGMKFLPAAGVSMWVVLFYGIMTGFNFSTIRAIVMLGLSLGGEIVGRKYDMPTGMALALGGLLIVDPFRIYDGGLILSFGAVVGVIVSKYILEILDKNKRICSLKKKRLYIVLSAFVFSNGINLITMPLISYMYFQVPLYSALVNMIVVPLMSVIVFCAFFAVLISFVLPWLGKIIIVPSEISLKIIDQLCDTFQKLPYRIINTGKPMIWELVVYYIVLILLLIVINDKNISVIRKVIHSKTRKWITYAKVRSLSILLAIILATFGLLIVITFGYGNRSNQIIFLDVGQGDGILIKTKDGTNMVIDIGSTSNKSLGQYTLCPALLSERMGHIDYWFVSHFDADHISGLEYVLNSEVDMGIRIDNLVVGCVQGEKGEQLINKASEKGINVFYMQAGDYVGNQNFIIRSIHPEYGFESEDENQKSLVLEYICGDVNILFTGDMGEEATDSILDGRRLSNEYDILKIPHHGSKYSITEEFICEVAPAISVISCGQNNIYGHPHQETLEIIEECNSILYRTDTVGAIKIEIIDK